VQIHDNYENDETEKNAFKVKFTAILSS